MPGALAGDISDTRGILLPYNPLGEFPVVDGTEGEASPSAPPPRLRRKPLFFLGGKRWLSDGAHGDGLLGHLRLFAAASMRKKDFSGGEGTQGLEKSQGSGGGKQAEGHAKAACAPA